MKPRGRPRDQPRSCAQTPLTRNAADASRRRRQPNVTHPSPGGRTAGAPAEWLVFPPRPPTLGKHPRSAISKITPTMSVWKRQVRFFLKIDKTPPKAALLPRRREHVFVLGTVLPVFNVGLNDSDLTHIAKCTGIRLATRGQRQKNSLFCHLAIASSRIAGKLAMEDESDSRQARGPTRWGD